MGKKKRQSGQGATAPAQDGLTLLQAAFEKLNAGRPKEAANLAKRAIKADPHDPGAQLIYGVAQLDSGKPALALSPLRKAAQMAPQDPEAHYQLGLTLRMLGEADAAADAITKALTLKPDFADGYRQLGMLLVEKGLYGQAEQALDLALQFNPEDAQVAFNLGIIAKSKGDEAKAIAQYSRAVSLDPKLAGAHINLGNIAFDHGKHELAAETYRKAIAADPKMAIAHTNLARALKELGEYEEAEAACREAIRLDPRLADGWNNLGNIFKDREELAEALKHYKRAHAINPEDGKILFNMGDSYYAMHRYEEAEKVFHRAITADPTFALSYLHLGLALVEMGRLEEAVENFEKAVEIEPDHDGYKCTLSQALVSLGTKLDDVETLDRGYAISHCCFECGLREPYRQFSIPKWQGESLEGKRLLVWREQGIGDEIRWSSFYPAIIKDAEKTVIEADPRLVDVFRTSFPSADVRPCNGDQDTTRRDADIHVPAYDLELLHKTRRRFVDRVRVKPWIKTTPEDNEFWDDRLRRLPSGLKVGICWRSGLSGRLRNPHYADLVDWVPLLEREDVQVVNLQYGDCESEIERLSEVSNEMFYRWDDIDLKDDFAKVLALISKLDLVVSAPTAVPEMAMAVGTPSWVLVTGASEPNSPPQDIELVKRMVWRRHVSENWKEFLKKVTSRI